MAVTWKKIAYEDEVITKGLLDAAGDIIYASGDNTPARLAAGANGEVLTLAAGVPSWAAGGAVLETDYGADTFMYATDNNTPVATSPADVMAALSGHAGATFDFNSQNLTLIDMLSATQITGYFNSRNIFGAVGVFSPEINNLFHRADLRFTVGSSGFSAFDSSRLFNSNYDEYSQNAIAISGTGVVTIDTSPEWGVNGLAYPQGYVYVAFNYASIPDSVSGRVQDKDSAWHDMTGAVNVRVSTDNRFALWRLTVPANTYAVTWEITINAGSEIQVLLTEIEMYGIRPSDKPQSVVTKYGDNDLWGDLDMNTHKITGVTSLNVETSLNVDAFVNLPSDESLVGYWALDDGSGTVAVDGSGNGNDGTLTNMEDGDWVDGVVGKCLDFDGTDEYVDCGTGLGTTLGNGVTNISVSFWFNIDVASANDGMFYIGDFAGSVGELAIFQRINVLRFNMHDNGFAQSVAFTDTTNSHHCVATYDGANGKLFLDGVEVISAAYTTGLDLSGLKTIIGAWYSSPGFGLDGTIDEVRVYSTVLTESEIKALFLYPAGNKGSKISLFQVSDITPTVAEINQLNDNTLTNHLTLHVTDTDGDTEGDIWYDASEDKLKFKTAAGVETITSV